MWIKTLLDKGFPAGWMDVEVAALEFANQKKIKFCASHGWREGFKSRHPEIICKLSEGLERTRVGGLNQELAAKYFKLVEETIRGIEAFNGCALTPDLVMNLDETGFDLVNGLKGLRVGIVTRKNSRFVHQASSDRTHHSAAVCIQAGGFRYKTMFTTKHSGSPGNFSCPVGCKIIFTEKGYFDDQAFLKYVKFLLEQIPDDGKARLLVLDGYGSHTLMPEVLKLFMNRNIHVICMPSHTSQALQPLDVTCFSPTKHYYRVDLNAVNARFGIKAANKFTVSHIFELAIEYGCSISNIKSGFQRCGLIPFDPKWPITNKDLFYLAEELDETKRKRKVEQMNEDEIPWQEVVVGIRDCQEAVSSLLHVPDIT